MANVTLAFRRTPTAIDTLELDCAISEKISYASEVTDHPVEQGTNIADHSRPKPIQISIEGLISNSPISREQSARASSVLGRASPDASTGNAAGYVEAALAVLERLVGTGVVFTVSTGLRSFDSMKLIALDVPRDRSTGDALRFSATFKQVRSVTLRTTVIETREPRHKAPDTKGGKGGGETPAPTARKSMLKRLSETDAGDTAMRFWGIRK